MAISYTDLVWEEGSENMGGMIGDLYFMPASAADISGLTCTDGISLIGNIVPVDVAEQQAVKIYATEGTIQMTDVQQGEIDGESVLTTLMFFFPGSTPATAATKRKLKTGRGIWFAKDTNGIMRVLGLTAIQVPTALGTYTVNKDIVARVTAAEGTHGTRGDERKGTMFTITYTSVHEPLFYPGVLPYGLEVPAE
jgi:hypothetical protein